MHGVKRLFAWMIPRFDPARFDVSLVSLRTKDTSEDTLEQHGIDVTYLHRGKFDPATLPALVKVLDDKKADIVHMHGYGATTFGRICAAYRKIPAILHEHANHTTTPWFQQVADSALAAYTDLAIAVSKSTADFVVNARKMPAEKTKVVYLGVPLEEFARPRSQDEIARARADLGVPEGALAIGTITASRSAVKISFSPSASVETIGLPIASASNAVSGVPSISDGNTTMSSAESAAATSRLKPENVRRSEMPSAFASACSASPSSPSPTMKPRAFGTRSKMDLNAFTRYVLPLNGISRVIVPIASAPSGTPRSARARAISSCERGRANSSSGTPR